MTKIVSDIVGQKIKELRLMTDEELDGQGWEPGMDPVPMLVLENGVKIFPSQDPEGNGGGMLFGELPNGKGIYVYPGE